MMTRPPGPLRRPPDAVDAVRTLARERIAPRAAEVDHTAEFPWDAVELLRENDVFALAFPEEYGGTGTGMLTHLRAVEELSWADATVGLVLAVQGLGGLPVLLDGTRGAAAGTTCRGGRAASGSPPTRSPSRGRARTPRRSRTRARRDGADWVLDGTKRFITNAGVAHTYVVFARAEAGIRAFMVEADDPGFAVGRIEPKMGIKGSTTGELLLDCVPPARRPPDRQRGRRLPPRDARARPLAARASPRRRSASARRRSTTPLRYAAERIAFGKPIADQQGIQFMLADMATTLEARPRARSTASRAMLDAGVDGPELTKLSAMCKLACLRRRDGGDDRRRPDPGRLRLHPGVPGRADDARRQDHADLRGHEPDPARS